MNNTINSINTLKMNGTISYDTVIEDAGRKIFQCEETEDSIYVLNTITKRATRFNAEGLNGKRISVSEFESKLADMLLRIAKQDVEITEEDLHRDAEELERYLQEQEERNTDEEVKEIAKKMAPKAKKARKSKDVGYTYSENGKVILTLTEKQCDFVRHLPDTCFWEHGLDSRVWIDILCDEIGGQFAGKPMTVGAMISTLCEKGLANRAKDRVNGKKCTSFGLTEIGQAVAIDLGLN